MDNLRLDWVDIVKGFAIISVVLLHIDYMFPNLYNVLPLSNLLGFSWHVPVFFLLAGFFLNFEKMACSVSFIKSKITSLYFPLLAYYIPAVLLHNVFIAIDWYDVSIAYGGKYVAPYSYKDFFINIVATLFLCGREPIVGPLWFVYVLFLSLCGISILCYLSNRISSYFKISKEAFVTFVLLFLCIVSSLLTQRFSINIPRFNNVFTAMWLIWVGYFSRNILKYDFTSKNSFFISIVICLYYFLAFPLGVALNSNTFTDIFSLTIGSFSVLVFLSFLSSKICNTFIGVKLAYLGKNSFHIMALHFCGFKIGVYFLYLFNLNYELNLLEAPSHNKWYLMLYFLFFGLLVPILFCLGYRCIKSHFSKK